MTREFKAVEAIRQNVPLLLGLTGASGSGKTWSALVLALGIQQESGGDIYVIDSDNSRALHYAGLKTAAGSTINFKHIPFSAPHDALAYRDAIRYCEQQKAGVIVVDTLSKEHDGEGGMLEAHDTELDRLAGNDFRKRESMSMLAWAKPKAARRKLIQAIQELETHALFTYRAKQGVKPVKVNGKTEVVQQGFTPIAGDEFVFEMTLNALLLPHSGGVATWESEFVGERMMIKLPEQFAGLRTRKEPIDEKLGRHLAKWATGGVARPVATEQPKPAETVAERPTPAAPDDFPGDRPAADVTTAPAEIEPASPVSEPSTETDAGTQDIGDDTGQPAGESALEPETATEPDSTDDGPQDRRVEENPPATTPAPDVGGFGECATAIAEAKDWPSIDAALMALRRSEAWIAASKATPDDLIRQAMIRRIAYVRLKELTDGGYRFDFVNDLQAWRCYIEWEEDLDALTGNRSAVHASQAWRAMDGRSDGTQAKLMLDRAYDARVVAIKAAAKASEYA